MKAKEADQFKQAPGLSDIESAAMGGHDHGTGHGHGDDHGAMMTSTRRATHDGHEIEITTCYEIKVDGEPLSTHLFVTNEGNLHSHAMPNYVFSSAVDLVKKIIDLYPEDFADQQGHGHGGHTHEHP